ncbi:hypothetical protein R3P38DRAFT_3192824 [Favolaschia claudopus]|uniref:Uncharacterized protein n=1 Tax=Favolaschia claudopus TaxID=2862362 RepID=A0AAW0BJD2_9AGAR
MKLLSILFTLATIGSALAQAIQLPVLPDGAYIISIGEDGKPTWTNITAKVAEPPAMVKREPASIVIEARPDWPSGTYARCPSGNWFLSTDLYTQSEGTWETFFEQCESSGSYQFPAGTALTNYQGTSVSYMCAYSANSCSISEWHDAVGWVQGSCGGRSNGWQEPAYLHIPAWNKRYGYAKSGSSIC